MRSFNKLRLIVGKFALTIFILTGQFLSIPSVAQMPLNLAGTNQQEAAGFILFFKKLLESSTFSMSQTKLPKIKAGLYTPEQLFLYKQEIELWNNLYLNSQSSTTSDIRNYRNDLMINCEKELLRSECEQRAEVQVEEKTKAVKKKAINLSRRVIEEVSRLYSGTLLNTINDLCGKGTDVKSCKISMIREATTEDFEKFKGQTDFVYGGIVFNLTSVSAISGKISELNGFLGVLLLDEESFVDEQIQKVTINRIMWSPKHLLSRSANNSWNNRINILGVDKESLGQRFSSFDKINESFQFGCELKEKGFCLILNPNR